MLMDRRSHSLLITALLVLFVVGPLMAFAAEEADPAEVAIGERLFKEWRFSQFFYEHFDGDVNHKLASGDVAVEYLETPQGRRVSPFRGQAISCASCHLVDQALELKSGGMRTYADFTSRTPFTPRADGATRTLRNTQAMVTPVPPKGKTFFLHHDGEFISHRDLSAAALTGRNMGWLAEEGHEAVRHIVKVVREDDGSGALAKEFGGAYGKVLKGTDPDIRPEFVLPPSYRVDLKSSSDDQVFSAVARLVAAYMRSLGLQKDENGQYTGSPFDRFLAKNGLPQKPEPGESDIQYSQRLRAALENKRRYEFVSNQDSRFKSHRQNFRFGPLEMEGLQIFLAERPRGAGAAGACLQCHAAPHFTDFLMHNTGVSQFEYESVHGEGRFHQLFVPSLEQRRVMSPELKGMFASEVSSQEPRAADLGLWNMFADGQHLKNQTAYRQLLGEVYTFSVEGKTDEELLPLTLGLIKTGTLRDLGHSNPYFHNGLARSLEDALRFYVKASEAARRGVLRNGDRRLANIYIAEKDVPALAAFLRSLNEDYE